MCCLNKYMSEQEQGPFVWKRQWKKLRRVSHKGSFMHQFSELSGSHKIANGVKHYVISAWVCVSYENRGWGVCTLSKSPVCSDWSAPPDLSHIQYRICTCINLNLLLDERDVKIWSKLYFISVISIAFYFPVNFMALLLNTIKNTNCFCHCSQSDSGL